MTDIALKTYVDRYVADGLSIIPIPYRQKAATIKWAPYQSKKLTAAEIEHYFLNNHEINIAVICGAISENLMVLDCDSIEKFYELAAIICKKLDIDDILDFTTIVKTGKGFHIYLKTALPVKSQKFPNLDIKGEGGYVIAPPSVHPSGAIYTFANGIYIPPIKHIEKLIDIGIDINQKQNNQLPAYPEGELIPRGMHDDWLYKRASAYRGQGDSQAIIIEKLKIDLTRCDQDFTKPYTEKDLLRISGSASRYSPNTGNNNSIFNMGGNEQKTVSKQDNIRTTSGQDGDKNWGAYSEKFDLLMREAGGAQDKRDVAETIGLRATSDTFRKLLSRRKLEGKVRPYRGSPYLIQWINKDYRVTQLSRNETTPMLDIKLPLNLHNYTATPPGSVGVVAGTTSGGKTSFLLEMAELNLFNQPMPIYYWYNEMSEAKLRYRCEDFPLLREGQAEGRFFPVKQTDFEFYDVLQPDAINLVDYIDRGDALYLIGEDIKQLYQALSTGIVVVTIQKKPGQEVGYGGTMSMKLANLYVVLNVTEHSEKATLGRAKITKAKDWHSDKFNPVGLSCSYRTGGKHGRLYQDGEWERH